MQSITLNEESLSRLDSKIKGQELLDNEAVSMVSKKVPVINLEKKTSAMDKAEADTADSSKQKSVSFNIP